MYDWGNLTYPYGVADATSVLAPQGLFGGMLGGLLGGPLGGAIGGLFGSGGRQVGSQIGSVVGGIGGGLLPFSTGPQLSVAGAEPSSPAQGPPRSILLPQNAVPPAVRTAVGIQNAVLEGAAKGAIGRVAQYLSDNPNSLTDARAEIGQLSSRALDFLDAGDHQSALVQAYLANIALDSAVAQEAQKKQG